MLYFVLLTYTIWSTPLAAQTVSEKNAVAQIESSLAKINAHPAPYCPNEITPLVDKFTQQEINVGSLKHLEELCNTWVQGEAYYQMTHHKFYNSDGSLSINYYPNAKNYPRNRTSMSESMQNLAYQCSQVQFSPSYKKDGSNYKMSLQTHCKNRPDSHTRVLRAAENCYGLKDQVERFAERKKYLDSFEEKQGRSCDSIIAEAKGLPAFDLQAPEDVKCPPNPFDEARLNADELKAIEKNLYENSKMNKSERAIYKRIMCSTLNWIKRYEQTSGTKFDFYNSESWRPMFMTHMNKYRGKDSEVDSTHLSAFMEQELKLTGPVNSIARKLATGYVIDSFDYSKNKTMNQVEVEGLFAYGSELLKSTRQLLQLIYHNPEAFCPSKKTATN